MPIKKRYDEGEDYGLVSEAGYCPKCGKQRLNYGAYEMQDDGGFYPCTCPDCHWGGKEWYNMSFAEYTDE